jgi:hypothetical protein
VRPASLQGKVNEKWRAARIVDGEAPDVPMAGANGRAFSDPEATLMLYSTYPTPVRRWIARRGGLTPHTIFLSGRPLQEMYRSC